MIRTLEETKKSFGEAYYQSNVWNNGNTTFMGYPIYQNPFDMWMLQEIIWELKPTLIIETGTAFGSSALYVAMLFDLFSKCGMKEGRVISIDIEDKKSRPVHPRVKYILGSSTDEYVLGRVEGAIVSNETVLVILDSDHTRDHVYAEMQAYSKFVSLESYMIVCDTNVKPTDDEGPIGAVNDFLENCIVFKTDKTCEKFGFTFNPNGYLRRVG